MELKDLKYVKEMAKHKLTKEELPADAKIGIDNIDQVLKAMRMAEKTGKKIKPETLAKVNAMDKWVYFEILDYVNDTDTNAAEIPVDAPEVIADLKDTPPGTPPVETPAADTPGTKIETELQKMFDSGKSSWTIDEIKASSKNVYDAIFVGYKEGDENGVETTAFSLIETTEKQVYSLKKL